MAARLRFTEDENPEELAGVRSRALQRKKIQREYEEAKRAEENAANTGYSLVKSIWDGLTDLKTRIVLRIKEHPLFFLFLAVFAVLVITIAVVMSSCATFLPESSGTIAASSFSASDEDILGTDEDYSAMEAALQAQIDRIETDNPGYDEYNYYLDEIGHDPYELAAYLTVLFEDYTRLQAQTVLRQLFDAQYTLSLEEVVETHYRTENGAEEPYDYYILNVTLTNRGIEGAISALGGLTEDQQTRYEALLQTKGNRPDLFADNPSVDNGSSTQGYEVPPERLSDVRFANMIREAEKYLGYPYVWGGASPETSFDCSGFVSWVINHCGNGWNYGRQTARGLVRICTAVSPSEAQPGDLIFFQGTYNVQGASHVGIYVGDNMMIHCGDPIQYTAINTPYWQEHFLSFGRLP